MRFPAWTSILIALIAAGACGQPDDAMRDRLDGLEQRLEALDQRVAALAKDQPAGERLRDDLRALEQRVGAAEAKATQALETAKTAPPAPPAAAAPRPGDAGVTGRAARPDPLERRAQLGTLMTEYRRRLAEAEARQGPGASVTERMTARREVREWYIARRRAILTGQPLPD